MISYFGGALSWANKPMAGGICFQKSLIGKVLLPFLRFRDYQNGQIDKLLTNYLLLLMKNTARPFSHLRVYRQMTTPGLVNLIACNRVMKMKSLVAHAPRLYKVSRSLMGPRLVDGIIKNTFCRALTAGNTLEEAEAVSSSFRKQGISIILDYCAQGEVGNKECQLFLEENARLFAQSAQALVQQNNQMISIKITGLVNMELLRSINSAVVQRNNFWAKNSQGGWINGSQLFKGLQELSGGISDEEFTNYLKVIFGYQGSPQEFRTDEVGFKMHHQPFYLQSEEKSCQPVIRLFFASNAQDRQKLRNFVQRLRNICDPVSKNNTGFKILVDAEQSYVQRAIECVSEQLQEIYNKQQLFILPTIQNYLKISVDRSMYEIEIAKRKGLNFGAKLVRGAYLVEESRLARQNGTENPIVDCFEKTTENYMKSFELMVKNFSSGEVVVASHNFDTIYDTMSVYKDSGSSIRVSYAQLLGLADHLTFKCKEDGFRVYKYLPWAKVHVMIPYMIRRAEELSQMKYPLEVQYDLLMEELKNRITI